MPRGRNGFDLPPQAGQIVASMTAYCAGCGLAYTRPADASCGDPVAFGYLLEVKGWGHRPSGCWTCPCCAADEAKDPPVLDLTGR